MFSTGPQMKFPSIPCSMEDSNMITGLFLYITPFNTDKHIVMHCNNYVTLCLLCVGYLLYFCIMLIFVRAIGLANKLFVFVFV